MNREIRDMKPILQIGFLFLGMFVCSFPGFSEEKKDDLAEIQVQAYEAFLSSLEEIPPPQEPVWFSDTPYCEKLSRQLLSVLREQGFDVKLIRIQATETLELRSLENIQLPFTHFFLVDDSLGPGAEIIIDPSYLQFFEEGAAPQLPAFFVGTHEDLRDLVEDNYAFVTAPWLDSLEEQPSPESYFVERTWGFGPAAGHRIVEKDPVTF